MKGSESIQMILSKILFWKEWQSKGFQSAQRLNISPTSDSS